MKFDKSKVISIILIIIYVGILVTLNKYTNKGPQSAASKLIFVKAHVLTIIQEDAYPDTWTEGRRLGKQAVEVVLDSGKHKGTVLTTVNYLNAYANVDLKKGTNIIVRLDYNENGDVYIASVTNYNRFRVLSLLIILFIFLLILMAGKKGISALLGLVFTVVNIWYFLIPLIICGVYPILATIVNVILATTVSLVLLNGFSKKTFCAIVGCVGGVSISAIIAAVIGVLSPINGFNMAEAEELVLRATNSNIHISGLLVSGILISSLGAVMDVAMTITSAVYEIKYNNKNLNFSRLFLSGMNIGKDAMGTMANTLILAFAGASLNTLILFRTFNYPYIQIFNSDMMAIEIIQAISGSIGIVLTVPLVAMLSAFLCTKYKNNVCK